MTCHWGLFYLQYIPRNMHAVFALLCFVVVIHWLIFPYPSGLLHWHCGNLTIAPVPAKQPWWIWINTSCEFIMNDCITTTKQSTTKPCAYFLGYTVTRNDINAWMGNNFCIKQWDIITKPWIQLHFYSSFPPLKLTHWGRATHISVGNLTIIGSDNGLSPWRRQAIIWTIAGILLIGPLWTNFSEILIGIQTFSFKKMHLKMSSAKWRPFCIGLNVFRHEWVITSHRKWRIWLFIHALIPVNLIYEMTINLLFVYRGWDRLQLVPETESGICPQEIGRT